MLPLWQYRETLFEYRNDQTKRDTRRRDGSLGPGPFLPHIRRELLEKLFTVEQKLTREYHGRKKEAEDYNSDSNFVLISDEEVDLVQENWNMDGDIANHAYRIAQKFGRMMDRPTTTPLRNHLEQYAGEINIDLFERIYELEAYRKNISSRYGITNDIEKRTVDYQKGQFREAH